MGTKTQQEMRFISWYECSVTVKDLDLLLFAEGRGPVAYRMGDTTTTHGSRNRPYRSLTVYAGAQDCGVSPAWVRSALSMVPENGVGTLIIDGSSSSTKPRRVVCFVSGVGMGRAEMRAAVIK